MDEHSEYHLNSQHPFLQLCLLILLKAFNSLFTNRFPRKRSGEKAAHRVLGKFP